MINWDISGNESLAWVDPTSVAAYAKGEIDAGARHSTMGPGIFQGQIVCNHGGFYLETSWNQGFQADS